jgi:hypothetical protein
MVRDFAEVSEKHFRAPLTYAIGYEPFPSPHVHMCVASSAELDLRWISNFLKGMVGPDPGALEIRPFDYTGNALPYSLKVADGRHGDGMSELVNAELYFPATGKENRPLRKRRAHHIQRIERWKASTPAESLDEDPSQ